MVRLGVAKAQGSVSMPGSLLLAIVTVFLIAAVVAFLL
jgi:hypothetical protein